MKNTKFEPIKLDYDSVAAAEWKQELDIKIEHLDKLKDYLSNFMFEVTDYNLFKSEPATTICNLITNSYGKDFPSYINLDALYTLVGFNQIEFNNLLHQVNSISIDLDWNTYEAPFPEFHTYTINQRQNDAYNLITYALNGIFASRDKLGVHVFPFDITKGMNGMVSFDMAKNLMRPNNNFILNIK
jgi:hypothetical protein